MFVSQHDRLDKCADLVCVAIALGLAFTCRTTEGVTLTRSADGLLMPVELNVGDTLRFTLNNGQAHTLTLEQTDANVLMTNLGRLKTRQDDGATLYGFTCRVRIDGQPMVMRRYVGSQESFYEPYVVNGMRIWFDGVAAIFDNGLLAEKHGECKPNAAARFAVSDMTDRICPEPVHAFCDAPLGRLDIAACYNGDNCWMGAFNGWNAHGGLDINMPPGAAAYTPLAVDDQWFPQELVRGRLRHRWRGVRTWKNGDLWTVQNHHLLATAYSERTSLPAGVKFAEAAGIGSNFIHHSHYVFKIQRSGEDRQVFLDPWILFWQAFEDQKDRKGSIRATIAPLAGAKVAQPTQFSSAGSRPGPYQERLKYSWTFGDGGWSNKPHPNYAYADAGVYPVTLVVDDGARRATITQHLTVSGDKTERSCRVLTCREEPSFRRRPVEAMDVFGRSVRDMPHTVHFVGRKTRPRPSVKTIAIENTGAATPEPVASPQIKYVAGRDWLTVQNAQADGQSCLHVSADATALLPGTYRAVVIVPTPSDLNPRAGFAVTLAVPPNPPMHWKHTQVEEVVHHEDLRFNRFYCTPYFWVRPQFARWTARGHNSDFYLTNGGRPKSDEFVRFNPDLERGRYKVRLADETPFKPEARIALSSDAADVNPDLNPPSRFLVRVKSQVGVQEFWINPIESRVIGSFEFDEGMDGYVDLLAEGSQGQVLADAIVFTRVKATTSFRDAGEPESPQTNSSSEI